MAVSRKCTGDQRLAALALGRRCEPKSWCSIRVRRATSHYEIRKPRPEPLIDVAVALTALAALCFPPICSRQSRRERSAQEAGAEGATAPETLRQTDRVTC